MEFLQSKAIILQTIVLKDFKCLVKLFTKKYGIISVSAEIGQYIQSGHIQIPNIGEVTITQNKYKKYTLKEIKPSYIYKNILVDLRKNSIVQFIIEILLKTTQETYSDNRLFAFINKKLLELDEVENNLQSFHLDFIREYIAITGHTPLNNYSPETPYFDISEGRFTSQFTKTSLNTEDSKWLYHFFFEKLSPAKEIPVFRLTHCLLDYLKYHLSLHDVQSLTFLKEVIMEKV